ncbi:unnamed protein product [Linum trigynum]|uniref:Uncharacterized protein n=1 Tax=Linum trigynum TaxID=586398 RepID=A0AAV2DV73_9ROSI
MAWENAQRVMRTRSVNRDRWSSRTLYVVRRLRQLIHHLWGFVITASQAAIQVPSKSAVDDETRRRNAVGEESVSLYLTFAGVGVGFLRQMRVEIWGSHMQSEENDNNGEQSGGGNA